MVGMKWSMNMCVFRGGSTSITKSMYIHILGVTCDYERECIVMFQFFLYVRSDTYITNVCNINTFSSSY